MNSMRTHDGILTMCTDSAGNPAEVVVEHRFFSGLGREGSIINSKSHAIHSGVQNFFWPAGSDVATVPAPRPPPPPPADWMIQESTIDIIILYIYCKYVYMCMIYIYIYIYIILICHYMLLIAEFF